MPISLKQLEEKWREVSDKNAAKDAFDCAEELAAWRKEVLANLSEVEREQRQGALMGLMSMGPLYDTAINVARQEIRELLGVDDVEG